MAKSLVDQESTARLMERIEKAKQQMGSEYILHPAYQSTPRHSNNPARYWPYLRTTLSSVHA